MAAGAFGINFKTTPVYECGATLLTLLVHPTGDQEDIRQAEIHSSLCAFALRTMYAANRDDMTPIKVKPPHVFRADKDVFRDMKTVQKRLAERMISGRMAMAFLQEAELGRIPSLPERIKRLSINQMAEFVLDEAEQSDAANVKTRLWRPSLPVIHIAAAALVVSDRYRRDGMPLGLEQLLWSQEIIETIVRLAMIYAGLLANSSKIAINADSLLEIRLV